MPDIEDGMKLQNWLSVLTFDVVKYIGAGGEVVIDWTADGLALRLTGVTPDTPGVHGRFFRLAPAFAPMAATPAPQEEEAP